MGTITSTNTAFNPGAFGTAHPDANGNLYVSDNYAGGIYELPVVQNILGSTKQDLELALHLIQYYA